VEKRKESKNNHTQKKNEQYLLSQRLSIVITLKRKD